MIIESIETIATVVVTFCAAGAIATFAILLGIVLWVVLQIVW